MTYKLLSGGCFAGAERGSRVSQFNLNSRGNRVRATKHAPRDPMHILERRHCLAEIVERGPFVLVERHRIIPPKTASAELRTAGRHETQGVGPADVSAGTAAARRLPREPSIIRRGRPMGAQEPGADAGRYSSARVEPDARATDAWRPAAPTRRYDCPEERADGRRLGG